MIAARHIQAVLLAAAFMPVAAPAHNISLPGGASHRHSETRIITEYPDGRIVSEVVAPGGTSQDGRPLPVGLVYTSHADGTQEWAMPDGSRVVRTAGGQVREYPPPGAQGAPAPGGAATGAPSQEMTMIVRHYANGLRTTRYRDGRVSREYTMPGGLFSNGEPIPPGFIQTMHTDGRVEVIYQNGGLLDGRRVLPGFKLISWPGGCHEATRPSNGWRSGKHSWHPPDCEERMANPQRPVTHSPPDATGNPQMPSMAAAKTPEDSQQPGAEPAQSSAGQTVLGRELGHIFSLFSGVRMPGSQTRARTVATKAQPPSYDYLEFERYGDLLIGNPRPGASLPDGGPIPDGYLMVRYPDGCEKTSLPQGGLFNGKSYNPGSAIWNRRSCSRKHGE